MDALRKVYLEITTECNMDCGMCLRHRWETAPATMSVETFGRVMAGLRKLASPATVQFSGFGEPTVHARFFDFLAEAKEAGLSAEVVTNGVLLDHRAADRLIGLGLDRLIVSLDGAGPAGDAATHGEAAGQVRVNLRRLYAAKVRRRSLVPEVHVLFVATRRNIRELPEVKRLARELGITGILVSNLVPYAADLAGEVLYADWNTARRDTPRSPWNPAVDLPRMDDDPAVREVISHLRATASSVFLGGAEVYGGGMRCRFAHEGCAAVGPTGDVSPCLALMHTYRYWFRGHQRRIQRHAFGNVHERALGAIWEGPEYRAFRRRVRRFEFSPCIDCGGCDLREGNQRDCFGNDAPACGACLWAAGLVQCP